MTEREWLASRDPRLMLRWIKNGTSKRKLRLFACASCRLVQDSLVSDENRKALDVGERFADGLADEIERQNAWREASSRYEEAAELAQSIVGGWSEYLHVQSNAAFAALVAVENKDNLVEMLEHTFWSAWSKFAERRSDLLRDLIGNPFCPVPSEAFTPLQEDATVRAIAHVIYEERRFEDLPILGDAIEESGCTEPSILQHCRQAGRHVRGCWLLDSLLRKS